MLLALSNGDRSAADRLLPHVYDELHDLAARLMGRERPDHTLQPTALAHDAYLRLIDQSRADWKCRAHFFAVAAETIRRILVDHARKHRAAKRGGDGQRIDLSAAERGIEGNRVDLLALDEALGRLDRLNERQRRVVDLRYFGGLSIDETALVLGVSPATVKADWHLARAWLRQQLGE
jgi:RNA polymerase sigma factor (TIGR02999 family)